MDKDVRPNEKLVGDATGRFALFALLSLLRIDTLGSLLGRRRSRTASGSSSSSLLGISSSRLFSADQRSPLRSEIADPETIRPKLLAKKGDKVRIATGNWLKKKKRKYGRISFERPKFEKVGLGDSLIFDIFRRYRQERRAWRAREGRREAGPDRSFLFLRYNDVSAKLYWRLVTADREIASNKGIFIFIVRDYNPRLLATRLEYHRRNQVKYVRNKMASKMKKKEKKKSLSFEGETGKLVRSSASAASLMGPHYRGDFAANEIGTGSSMGTNETPKRSPRILITRACSEESQDDGGSPLIRKSYLSNSAARPPCESTYRFFPFQFLPYRHRDRICPPDNRINSIAFEGL